MKKSSFITLILGTIGGVFFALGMCMALLPEWGKFDQGVICGVIGLAILFITLLVWRKMTGKAPIKLNGRPARASPWRRPRPGWPRRRRSAKTPGAEAPGPAGRPDEALHAMVRFAARPPY